MLIKAFKRTLTMMSFLMLIICHNAIADIAVITHTENASKLSLTEIRLKFLGKRLHPDSDALKMIPVNLPFGHPTRSSFDREVLNKSEANIRTYWARMIFTSRARPPREFTDEKQIIAYIKQHPETVGYIDADKVSDEIKVLFTISSPQKKASQ